MDIFKTIITLFSILILLFLELVIHIMGISSIIYYRNPVNQDSKTAFLNGIMISSIIVAIGIVIFAICDGWLA